MAGKAYANLVSVALDGRVALVLFLLLLAAAVAPILFAWLALLPSEREPFAAPDEAANKKPRDGFAIFLLANISIALLLWIPGLDAAPLSSHIARLIPNDWPEEVAMVAAIWFGFIPGLAAAYSAVRANPIRWQLLVGGVLALVLWLVGPWLLEAIAGST